MTKRRKRRGGKGGGRHVAPTLRESAQQLWLAGLGAFARTQAEGAKAFEALVRQGKAYESRTRPRARAKMSELSGQWSKTASQATARAAATWDKLEQLFEDRVGRALRRLGVPTNRDIQQLSERVAALAASVRRLSEARRRRATGGSAKRGRGRRRSSATRP